MTTNPEYKNAGTYTVYFEVTSSGYNAYHGSGTVKINKANASYNAPYAVSDLKYNGNEQNLVNAGSSNVLYSLDGESYSADVPKRTFAEFYLPLHSLFKAPVRCNKKRAGLATKNTYESENLRCKNR